MYIENDPVELLDDPTPVFQERHRLFCQTKSRLRTKFTNRENFLDAPFNERYPQSSLFDKHVVKRQIYGIVYDVFYFRLREVLTDEGSYEDYEYDPNVMHFTLVDNGEYVKGVQHIEDNIFRISDALSVKLPVSKAIVDDCEIVYFGVRYQGEGEFKTGFGMVDEFEDTDSPEDADVIEYLFKTAPSREQREAFAIYQDNYECALVAMGERAISVCSYPDRYTDMKRFPVDSIVWSQGDEDEEKDDEEDDSTEFKFIYNTDLLSEEEVVGKLESYAESTQGPERAASFGEVLGYPEYATTQFASALEQSIPPAYQNDIEYYYQLLSGDISPEELEVLEYVSYVTPLTSPEFEKTLADGRTKRDAVHDFIEMYDLPVEISKKEYTSVDDLPQDFDEIWTVEEIEPEFSIKSE